MTRNEHEANNALDEAAQQRADVVRVLGAATLRPLGSKTVTRHNHQRVAKKQHTGLLFCVMLAASALIGCLLAF